MYKKIFAVILTINCVPILCTSSENNNTAVTGEERIVLAQINAAKESLNTINNHPSPMAIAEIVTGVMGVTTLILLYLTQNNPALNSTITRVGGGIITASIGSMFFTPNESDNHHEKKELISIINQAAYQFNKNNKTKTLIN